MLGTLGLVGGVLHTLGEECLHARLVSGSVQTRTQLLSVAADVRRRRRGLALHLRRSSKLTQISVVLLDPVNHDFCHIPFASRRSRETGVREESELDSPANVFDYVDESEYARIVQQRQEEGFILDDGEFDWAHDTGCWFNIGRCWI